MRLDLILKDSLRRTSSHNSLFKRWTIELCSDKILGSFERNSSDSERVFQNFSQRVSKWCWLNDALMLPFKALVSSIYLYDWLQKSVQSVQSSSCTFFESFLQVQSPITPKVLRPWLDASTRNILNMGHMVNDWLIVSLVAGTILWASTKKSDLPFLAKEKTEKIVIKMIRFILAFSSDFSSSENSHHFPWSITTIKEKFCFDGFNITDIMRWYTVQYGRKTVGLEQSEIWIPLAVSWVVTDGPWRIRLQTLGHGRNQTRSLRAVDSHLEFRWPEQSE